MVTYWDLKAILRRKLAFSTVPFRSNKTVYKPIQAIFIFTQLEIST